MKNLFCFNPPISYLPLFTYSSTYKPLQLILHKRCVFYRIPCKPTGVSCRNYNDLENPKKGSLREIG